MEPTILDEHWDSETLTGYRIEKTILSVRRIKLASREQILNEFKADLCTQALQNWVGFSTNIENLWKFFDFQRKVYSRTSVDYFVLKRAYPVWTIEEILQIIDDVLIIIKKLPAIFKHLYMLPKSHRNILPPCFLWGMFQAVHPNYYTDCSVCLKNEKSLHSHGTVSDNEVGCETSSCVCQRNLMVFVPCGHAVCAIPCYELLDKTICLLCQQTITDTFSTQNITMPTEMMALLSAIL